LQRLDVSDQPGHDAETMRGDLDSELGVAAWRITRGLTGRPLPPPVDDGAPSWWHGDEEASQTFLRDQGVRL
jgi:hypothetical protein